MSQFAPNTERQIIEATLQLFHGIPVNITSGNTLYSTAHRYISRRTIEYGYTIYGIADPTDTVLDLIENTLCLYDKQVNASFHKSWAVVKNTPIETLVAQQLIHYFTTYGMESIGLYDEKFVYTPDESLDLPCDNIALLIIHGLTLEELAHRTLNLCTTRSALSEETLKYIMVVLTYLRQNNALDNLDYVLDTISNNELLCRICSLLHVVPREPVALLRYIIYTLTDDTLLIKNKQMIHKIESAGSAKLDGIISQLSPDMLAPIFLRFKPLFLAMKRTSTNKSFFNRMRKLATKLHQPLPADYFNEIVNQVRNCKVDFPTLKRKLQNIGVFRKIRVLKALRFYDNAESQNIVYRIRNCKVWVDTLSSQKIMPYGLNAQFVETHNTIYQSIIDDISKNVSGKTFYIPEGIYYALPSSEKQFVGSLPVGTEIIGDKENMVFGIHWTDGDYNSIVDLDLSTISMNGRKIGWNSYYRDIKVDGGSILFSGDMTYAPKPDGASELIRFQNVSEPHLLIVNYYNNYNHDSSAKFKFFVGNTSDDLTKNYMISQYDLMCSCNMEVTGEIMLGLVRGNTIILVDGNLGNQSVSCDTRTSQILDYLLSIEKTRLCLESALTHAGANVVRRLPVNQEYVDLSPGVVTSATFLNDILGVKS
jgi:hypothetical protein